MIERMPASPLLRMAGVQVRYGDAEPLFPSLSLQVGPGEIVALQGRSGSGKSTTLSVAMGMLPPSSGSVSWQGTDLYALTDDERARIRREHFGVVLQDGGLLQGLTALENVLVPVLNRRATRADRQRARDALAMVGLSARADHSPQNLSGGEGQRVAVARALFSDPKLLFVDEPTASLDRRNADDIIGLLVEVARDGRGVLLASHDPAVIAVADRFHEIEAAIAQASPKSLAPR